MRFAADDEWRRRATFDVKTKSYVLPPAAGHRTSHVERFGARLASRLRTPNVLAPTAHVEEMVKKHIRQID